MPPGAALMRWRVCSFSSGWGTSQAFQFLRGGLAGLALGWVGWVLPCVLAEEVPLFPFFPLE